MKILVLNGSPKGEVSVTMQYVQYLRQKFPHHDWKIENISQRIKRLERDEAAFQAVLKEVSTSNLVLWATPVYYLLVPGQMKRFIELVFEQGVDAFAGKYAAALTTSIHFYDHTAHNYLRAVCDDLKMRFVSAYSAEMMDLEKPAEREKILSFGASLLSAMEGRAPTSTQYPPLVWSDFRYQLSAPDLALEQGDRKILIISDGSDPDGNLAQMVRRFRSAFKGQVQVIDLQQVGIKGGCQGCLQCGYDNQCVYTGRDNFTVFYETQVMAADVIVFAGKMHDRYLSALWKTYFDRSFFRGHAPSLAGKQVCWLISGPLGQNANLRQILEAYTEMQHANLAGIVTDEVGDSAVLDRLLDQLAMQALAYAQQGYIRPMSFLGVGGRILFRDAIWGRLRLAFQADHKAYQELGFYDFPHKDYRQQATNAALAPLLRLPKVRQEAFRQIRPGMIRPLQKVLQEN